MLKGKRFNEIQVGDTATVETACTNETIASFAQSTGDHNPVHLDDEAARAAGFPGRIAHGLWTGGLVSAVIGMHLPGPGSIYISQDLKFLRPVAPGDTLKTTVTVSDTRPEKRHVILKCEVLNQKGKKVLEGEALVMAPA